MHKLWKTPVLRDKTLLSKFVEKSNFLSLSKFSFSAGGHGTGHSGSGSDNEHHEEHHDSHDSHHEGPLIIDNYSQEVRSRIFKNSEIFSVDKLLTQLNEPLNQTTPKLDASATLVHKSQEEYINFLAQSFERKALEKYPEYKTHLSQFKHLIPNYESLNAYAREAYTLDTYLHWKLEVEELQTREAYNFSGSPADRASQRLSFFQNLTQEDHHHDTSVMHHLKDQLKELIKEEKEFEDFKHRYNDEIEKQLINDIVEKKKKTFYYEIVENKKEFDRQQLIDLNSEGNKHKFVSHAYPHDHIHPQHYNHDPEKLNEEKPEDPWKDSTSNI